MKSPKKSTCPNQTVLELLGRPHMLHIIHTIGTASCGFNELQKVTGINTRTLTKRLQELQTAKLISVACANDARCKNYQLTAKGLEMDRILRQLPKL